MTAGCSPLASRRSTALRYSSKGAIRNLPRQPLVEPGLMLKLHKGLPKARTLFRELVS